jgi:translation elongation factor EF-G
MEKLRDYARQLSSIAGGPGSYITEPAHYEVVPSNIQQKIVTRPGLVAEEVH